MKTAVDLHHAFFGTGVIWAIQGTRPFLAPWRLCCLQKSGKYVKISFPLKDKIRLFALIIIEGKRQSMAASSFVFARSGGLHFEGKLRVNMRPKHEDEIKDAHSCRQHSCTLLQIRKRNRRSLHLSRITEDKAPF